MKKQFLLNVLIWIFIPPLIASDFNFKQYDHKYSIIYVHLGANFPNYLIDALTQARLFNPNNDIIVVGNQSAFEQNKDKNEFDYLHIMSISCEDLPMSTSHQLFLQKSKLNQTFRNGFWTKTTERFFYLAKVIKQFNLTNVFHLENDNMLYVNLEELLPVFVKHYPTIGAVFESDSRCIPSFMFFRNLDAIEPLVQYIAKRSLQGINDMRIIALYKNKFNLSAINHLPIIPEEYSYDHILRNNIGQKAKSHTLFSHLVKEFNSVFDGAAYGQYLGGIDPRNGISKPGFINESAFYNPSLFEYEWIEDEQQRKIPHIRYKEKLYRLNNLHIHCKNLKLFKSN